MSVKKIGFVDYYISEWHANNYPQWIKEVCDATGAEYSVAYAWAELDISPKYGESTDEWCERMCVEKCNTIDELCKKSDVIVILAPSDPETHLKYAEAVLKYGKPTYIDKTFAPDLATAKKIFSIAENYNVPFFSTSALRYGEELDTSFDCREIITTGSGSDLAEYIIHQVEMVVKKLGVGAERIKAERAGKQVHFRVSYGDGRVASMVFAPSIPFTVYMAGDGSEKPVYKPVKSEYFKSLMADMVRFFDEKTVSFDIAETLEVMKIREGAIRAFENENEEWITL